jgi:hypothetical protein
MPTGLNKPDAKWLYQTLEVEGGWERKTRVCEAWRCVVEGDRKRSIDI